MFCFLGVYRGGCVKKYQCEPQSMLCLNANELVFEQGSTSNLSEIKSMGLWYSGCCF